MDIAILGTGCPKCKALAANTEAAATVPVDLERKSRRETVGWVSSWSGFEPTELTLSCLLLLVFIDSSIQSLPTVK